jgi:uncharacterized membrane protein YeiB
MKELNEEQLDMIEDQASGELPEDQKDFLKSLEAEEALENAEPEQSQAQQAEQAQQVALDTQTAQMTAMGGLAMIEFALKRVIHKEFEFTPDTKAYAIENLSPILIKYGALLPAWLTAYDAEIKAAMAVGKLVSEGVDTAQTLKAKDAAKAKEAAKDDSNQQEKERVRVAA